MPGCKFDNEIAVLGYERIGNANDSATALTGPSVKRALDVGRVAARCRDNRYSERRRRRLR